MVAFPTSIKTFTEKEDNVDTVLAAHVNDIQVEVVATELKIGTGSSTPADGKVMRGSGAGASSWEDDIQSKSITIENPDGSEDISMFFANEAITITEIRAVLIGASTPSVTWTIRHNATDRSAGGSEVVTGGTVTTSVTGGDDVTSFNDATIPADSFVWLETTAKSGTVTELQLTIYFTKDS